MMSLEELRLQLRAASPTEMLGHLNDFCRSPGLPEDFRAPLIEIHLMSGVSFSGYLLDVSSSEARGDEASYAFSRKVVNDSDTAADIIYVHGSRIEAVTVYSIIDYPGALPAPKMMR